MMMNISQQITFFDRKFVANALRNHLRCPRCRNEFTHNYQMIYGDSRIRSNRPFLLHCGHNMCENCIFQSRHNLTCSVCLRPTTVSQTGSNINVRECFDINFFLFGEVQFYHFTRSIASNNSLRMTVTEPHIAQKCVECEEVPGLGICKQCKFYYCNLCFEKVHKHSKVLKRHFLRSEQGVIVKLIKSNFCERHRKQSDRFCKKCRLQCCLQCLQVDHIGHSWSTVVEQNELAKEDVNSLLHSIKDSRDYLRKAQKDVKSTESQLEQYASDTMSSISDFFLQMHSFLQLEERRISDHFHAMSLPMQQGIRDAFAKLNQTQSVLNNIRSNLEFYNRKPPKDILLHDVILDTNNELEELQYQVQVSKLTRNPFIFRSEKEIRKELQKFFSYSYQDPELNIRIEPIHGDLNRPCQNFPSVNFEIYNQSNRKSSEVRKQESITSTHSVESSLKSRTWFPDFRIEKARSPTDSTMKNQKNNCLARISHLTSPADFYIQIEDMLPQIRDLSNKCGLFCDHVPVKTSVSEGSYYMAYSAEDQLWYRAEVKKILGKDQFRLFLLDFGICLELPRQRLCEIDESFFALPFAAIRCALSDIVPIGKKWTEEANQFLMEITNNKSVRVSIVEEIDSHNWEVDLFTTHTMQSVSVCASFLYAGLARERPLVLDFKLRPKQMCPVEHINQRLPRHSFKPGESVMVQVIHVEDPQEFFAIKLDEIAARKKLMDELNQMPFPNPTLEKIFWAPLQMCCAVKGKNSWHRACVLDVQEGGRIRIRLVDEGSQETVTWNRLFVLPEKFRMQKEFAIKCSLADIEPLQKNNYTWSEEGIREFKQLSANPKIHMFICSVKQAEYQVALYVNKNQMDINIASMLVKYEHALSTGEASQTVEIFKSAMSRVNGSISVAQADESTAAIDRMSTTTMSTEKPDVNIIKRTAVYIRHINNPGEFYLSLKSLETGYSKFHLQIQELFRGLQGMSDMQRECKDWSVGEHCLVYTNYKLSQKQKNPATNNSSKPPIDYEWYRGIIEAIDLEPEPEYPFSVFLRDVGATVRSIRQSQLCLIDPQLDRVCNAALRCHLAWVQPTGGVATWSHTSVDNFKRNVAAFQNLGISQQGTCSPDTKSFPIVLWGMTTETTDPLAPCISKYVNINRILINSGLAHLVEPMKLTQQMNRIIEQERADGQITIEEWFENFSASVNKIDLHRSQDVIEFEECHESLNSELDLALDVNGTLDDPEELHAAVCDVAAKTWVKSKNITKSIFTAYPTNVGIDAIVYLHDANDHSLLEKISLELKRKYSQRALPSESVVSYKLGQPCIARYHMDDLFYRGIIKKIFPQDNFEVLFIDYGNVEPCNISQLLPFAPFPKLPALASRYSIEGIRTKNSNETYPTAVLDFIHSTIVGKFVSLRVATSEISKEVKKCSIRVGSEDLLQMLVAKGMVYSTSQGKEYTKIYRKSLDSKKKDFNNNGTSNVDNDMPRKSCATNTVYYKHRHMCYMLFNEIERKFDLALRRRSDVDHNEYHIKHPQNRDNDKSDHNEKTYDDGDIDDRFNEFLDRLNTEDIGRLEADLFSDLQDTVAPNTIVQQTVLPLPPAKKRMFDIEDYKKMQEQINYDDLCKSIEISENIEPLDFGDPPYDNSNDEDVVELDFSFASNYWHTDGASETNRHRRKKGYHQHKIPRDLFLSDDIENVTTDDSWYDKFQPNDTSSVFSCFKSTDLFRAPELPSGIQNFFCTVAAVVAPTLLYVFPHIAELEYRATKMERAIKRLVGNAFPLKQFEPKSACLAYSPKNNKWHRAVLRSYNSTFKEAVLIYVDQVTIETVPIRNLRQYPKELSSWPLYTLPVKLAGLKPNPHMRAMDVRQALINVVAKRTLYAHVKQLSHESSVSRNVDDETGITLMEVELYESKKLASSSLIYEELIKDKLYIRK